MDKPQIKEGMNIEIDGFPFYMSDVNMTVSFPYRELITTKIMNGTETNSQGDWQGRDFSFTTFLKVAKGKKNIYDKYFNDMMHKPCEVFCSDLGDKFLARIIIKKQLINSSPNGLKLEISVKELPDVTDYYIDNNMLTTKRLKTTQK